MGSLPILLGGAHTFLRVGAQRQFLRQSTVCVGLSRHTNWGADVGGGVEAQDIGLSYGWGLLRLFCHFRRCEEVQEEEG